MSVWQFHGVANIQQPASAPLTPTNVNQRVLSAAQEMIESFEKAVINSAKKLTFRPLLKATDTAASPMMQQHHVQADHISDTGKELWQSLAQATSQKRSPSYKKPADVDREKCSPAGVRINGGEKVGGIVKDDSESGDGSCSTSATLSAVVPKQIESVMERVLENGAGDAKSSMPEEPATAINHRWASWHTGDEDAAADPEEEESIVGSVETSMLEDESVISTAETGQLDMSEVLSGEESFYSVASCDHAAAETADGDAEPAAAADDDDDDDDDAAHVKVKPNGTVFFVSTLSIASLK